MTIQIWIKFINAIRVKMYLDIAKLKHFEIKKFISILVRGIFRYLKFIYRKQINLLF